MLHSYDSIKLGVTSLLWRFALLAALGWSILLFSSGFWSYRDYLRQVEDLARMQGRISLEKDSLYLSWLARQQPVYAPVPVSNRVDTNFSSFPEQSITTPSGKKLTLMDHTYMARQVTELAKELHGGTNIPGHLSSLKPHGAMNITSQWEKETLSSFERGAVEAGRVEIVDGKPYYHYMKRLIMEKSCLACHSAQGKSAGEIRGGVSELIPMGSLYEMFNDEMGAIYKFHGSIWLLGLGIIGFGTRKLSKKSAKIKESERFLRKLTDVIPGMLAYWDTELRCSFSNAGYKEWFGKTVEQMRGIHIREFMGEELYLKNEAFILAALQGVPRTFERTMTKADGSVGHSEVHYIPELDGAEVLGFFVMITDITERNQIAVALQKSETSLADVIKGTNVGTWEWNIQTGEAVMNERAAQIIGCTLDELSPISIETWNSRIHPDDFKALRELQMTHFRGNSETLHAELRLKHKSGDWIWVLDRGSVTRRSEDGTALFMHGTFMDITERKLTEENLRTSNKHNRIFTENAIEIVWTMNQSGALTYVSPSVEKVMGYTQEEALQMSFADFLTPESLSKVTESLRNSLASIQAGQIPEDFHAELEQICKDGTLIWADVRVSNIIDSNGNFVEKLGMSYDITELKHQALALEQARDAADAANRAKSEFLAMMSHEIRTPMNGILGMSSMLMESDLTPEQHDYAGIVSRSGEHLLVLINDILDFSKIESGNLELEQIDFNLQHILDDINRLLAYRAKDAGLELTYRIEPAVQIFLQGDPGRVRQVVTNLVGNALKFTEKGSVTVTASLVSDQDGTATIKFSICDTGIGIPESRLAAIFAPFTQVDASTTRKYGGTGLGLAISKQLVELMGGEIGVTSEEGKGSTFWFTARFDKQSAETLAAKQVETLRPEKNIIRSAEKLGDLTARILLAEDNAINQKVALHMLQKLGYSADVVANGQQAVVSLSQIAYDLVLMDCMMPVMDGFKTTAVIRDPVSTVLNHNIPVIAMTANAMKEDRDKCIAAGMDDYVSKPVKKEALAAVLEKWLSSAHPLRNKTVEVGIHDLDRLKGLTVLYVEDDDETRFQYSQFLSRMVGTLITAKDGAEGLAAYHLHHPDIIITDIKMPVMDGLAMMKQVRSHNKSLPAIVLSAFEITEDQRQSGDLGELRHEMKPVNGTKLGLALLECADGLMG